MSKWQYGSTGGHASSYASSRSPQQKDEWATWKCPNCSAENWLHYGKQKKNCWQCGIKRSYQQVLIQETPSSHALQNSVKAKLDAVIGQLQNVAPRPSTVSEPTAPCLNRENVNEEIKALEASIKSLPEDASYDSIRASIAAKISDQKQSLIRAKPIGAQVDACRALVTRSQISLFQ